MHKPNDFTERQVSLFREQIKAPKPHYKQPAIRALGWIVFTRLIFITRKFANIHMYLNFSLLKILPVAENAARQFMVEVGVVSCILDFYEPIAYSQDVEMS